MPFRDPNVIENSLRNPELVHHFRWAENTVEHFRARLTDTLRDQLLSLLGIFPQQFHRIHTNELKLEQLTYHWLQTEAAIIADEVKNARDREETNKKLMILKSIFVELRSLYIKNPQDNPNYTKLSRGLWNLDIRTPTPTHLDPNEVTEKDKRHSLVFVKKKNEGVERGYIEHLIQDGLLRLYTEMPEESQRWQFLREKQGNIVSVAQNYQDLPEHMDKCVHKTLLIEGDEYKVEPELDDLRRTGLVKNSKTPEITAKLYQREKTVLVEKRFFEVLQELIGNDIARAFGMEVQDQRLQPSFFENGIVRGVLTCEMTKDATTLSGDKFNSKTGKLEKSEEYTNAGEDNKKYRVKRAILKESNISYLSDEAFEPAAQFLPLLQVQGDNDGVGRQLQNKLMVYVAALNVMTFFGIDFGHAYQLVITHLIRSDFSISTESIDLSKLFSTDFFSHLVQSVKSKFNPFKNYSVFLDSPRVMIAKGILRLARMAGREIPKEIIESYDETFQKELAKIEPGSVEKIFDDYIKKMDELASYDMGTDAITIKKNKQIFTYARDQLKELKPQVLEAHTAYLNKFVGYIIVPKKVVDLVEAFSKVMEGAHNTSLRSVDQKDQDNQVLLNHLRIIDPSIVHWRMFYNEKLGKYELIAQFNDHDAAMKAASLLRSYAGNILEPFDVKTEFDISTVKISFEPACIPQLCSHFREDNITRTYHKDDYALLCSYRNEKSLVELLKQVAEQGIENEIKSIGADGYMILLKGKIDDKILAELAENPIFKISEVENGYTITFHKTCILHLHKVLAPLPLILKREKEIATQTSLFDELSKKISDNIGSLERGANNQFTFIIPQDCDQQLQKIMQEELKDFQEEGDDHKFTVDKSSLPEFNAGVARLKMRWAEFKTMREKAKPILRAFDERITRLVWEALDKRLTANVTEEGLGLFRIKLADHPNAIWNDYLRRESIELDAVYDLNGIEELTKKFVSFTSYHRSARILIDGTDDIHDIGSFRTAKEYIDNINSITEAIDNKVETINQDGQSHDKDGRPITAKLKLDLVEEDGSFILTVNDNSRDQFLLKVVKSALSDQNIKNIQHGNTIVFKYTSLPILDEMFFINLSGMIIRRIGDKQSEIEAKKQASFVLTKQVAAAKEEAYQKEQKEAEEREKKQQEAEQIKQIRNSANPMRFGAAQESSLNPQAELLKTMNEKIILLNQQLKTYAESLGGKRRAVRDYSAKFFRAGLSALSLMNPSPAIQSTDDTESVATEVKNAINERIDGFTKDSDFDEVSEILERRKQHISTLENRSGEISLIKQIQETCSTLNRVQAELGINPDYAVDDFGV